ncbi:MAG: hypothetical protein IJW96_01155 [Clostridia bacterium]|nr:hypothetical protein [Clostridia bacterium]
MKIKKITIPALLLALSTFSGCASASKTTFNNYWNTDALVMEALNETLTYDVTFEGNADYYGYQLRYENGSYTTELVTSVSESGQNLYTYKTELNIDVIYTLGEESVTLHDLVTSEVVFMPAENGLRPLSSKKSILSHSPAGAKPAVLSNCYRKHERSVETIYTQTNGTCTMKNGATITTNVFAINQKGYSHLDNEQLHLALRALPSSVSSATFSIYSPFTNTVQNVIVGFGGSENKDFTYQKNGVEVTETVVCRPVQYRLDSNNSGATQSAYIAVATEPSKNANRNRMLYLETPLAYSLGKLVYKLSSISD